MTTNRDLELLYEIGCLRFINRTWSQFLGPNFANLADHHFRVIWLVLLLAKMEKKPVNLEKAIKMAVVHDLAESRTGDVHYISRQYTKRNEKKAMRDILKKTSLKQEMLQIWQEYEGKKTLEAKIVKDADWLDVDLEIQEQKAAGRIHMKAWDDNRKIIYGRLYTKQGKKLWKLIKKSDPVNWYRTARNRFVEGDLAKEVKARK
jgi:putative hydrolase of HD superfamily